MILQEKKKKGREREESAHPFKRRDHFTMMREEDEGSENSRPWKRARLMKPMKVLFLVSAFYLLTARNDEVQICDKPVPNSFTGC